MAPRWKISSCCNRDNRRTMDAADRSPWQPLGLLRVRIIRGVNLAVRDFCKQSSDPYVLVRMGKEKLKTHVIKKNLNPEWNEELTLSVTEPIQPLILEVFDRDTFSLDDPMGNVEINIEPLLEVIKMKREDLPEGTMIRMILPSKHNSLAKESLIYWSKGMVVQDLMLQLKNVQSGIIDMQLKWVTIPNVKGI